jgi:glycerol kinase
MFWSVVMALALAIDAGTTGVRTLAFDENGLVVDSAYRELTQYFPRPGWVEHDTAEIWATVASTLREVSQRQVAQGRSLSVIGITNQRETLVSWHTRTGRPAHRAIVWQDRRSAEICERLRESGHEELVRSRTGLVLDPYFTATKIAWLLGEGGLEVTEDLVLSTVDAWLIWNLTGGSQGGVLVTDVTNASRTLVFDIGERRWSEELAELFGVPLSALPEVVPSCGRVGRVAGELGGTEGLGGLPISGIAGDQQAALFGQACFRPQMAKVTNGTGSFVLLNRGPEMPEPIDGVLTTVGWDLGSYEIAGNRFSYALEGSVFVSGAAIQWLRDGLGIIEDAAEIGSLAESIPDSEGVFVVPAFTGLGSPWWDPHARGIVLGLTRGVGRGHIARAVVESMAFQVRDVIEAMTAGTRLDALRVDGGASSMDLLLQLTADQLQTTVARPTTTETTALGAATLAGLAEGVWGSQDLESLWRVDVEFEPRASHIAADTRHALWLRAVGRSRDWA